MQNDQTLGHFFGPLYVSTYKVAEMYIFGLQKIWYDLMNHSRLNRRFSLGLLQYNPNISQIWDNIAICPLQSTIGPLNHIRSFVVQRYTFLLPVCAYIIYHMTKYKCYWKKSAFWELYILYWYGKHVKNIVRTMLKCFRAKNIHVWHQPI